jgi:hypothetical protein
MWWCTVTAVERLRQDHKFQASLAHTVNTSLKNKQTK